MPYRCGNVDPIAKTGRVDTLALLAEVVFRQPVLTFG